MCNAKLLRNMPGNPRRGAARGAASVPQPSENESGLEVIELKGDSLLCSWIWLLFKGSFIILHILTSVQIRKKIEFLGILDHKVSFRITFDFHSSIHIYVL